MDERSDPWIEVYAKRRAEKVWRSLRRSSTSPFADRGESSSTIGAMAG
jgi:hypothetical protein